MPDGILDTLVKLASLGASGVCVLAIFWVGWLISKVPPDANANTHKTMRMYMGMTIMIAVIAFASGIANAWFNAQEIAKVEKEKSDAVTHAETVASDLSKLKTDTDVKIAEYKAAQIQNQEVVKSIAMVVDEKELAAKEQDASEEMKSHIRILKGSIDRLNATESLAH